MSDSRSGLDRSWPSYSESYKPPYTGYGGLRGLSSAITLSVAVSICTWVSRVNNGVKIIVTPLQYNLHFQLKSKMCVPKWIEFGFIFKSSNLHTYIYHNIFSRLWRRHLPANKAWPGCSDHLHDFCNHQHFLHHLQLLSDCHQDQTEDRKLNMTFFVDFVNRK